MMKNGRQFKRFSLLLFLFLVGTSSLTAQVTLEGCLSANLPFDLVNNTLSIYYHDPTKGDAVATRYLTMSSMVCVTATLGYRLSGLLLGLEVAFFSGDAAGGLLDLSSGFWKNSSPAGTAGTDKVSCIKVGPTIRYYFLPAGIRPFLGMAVDFGILQITLAPASGFAAANSVGLEGAGLAGVTVDVTSSFYLGAIARLQLFYPVWDRSYKDVAVSDDEMHAHMLWPYLSLGLIAGYKI
jgi:hypothetical protein